MVLTTAPLGVAGAWALQGLCGGCYTSDKHGLACMQCQCSMFNDTTMLVCNGMHSSEGESNPCRAVQLSGTEFFGRQLKIGYAQPRK